MSNLAIPFNIDLLRLTPEKLIGIKPVRSLDIFDGASRDLNEDGLFSISIFGRIGDEKRSKRFSYIDIKVEILHPVVYRALGQLKRFYHDLLAGRAYAVWDEMRSDFVKSTSADGGFTGYQFFMDHWQDIVFEERPSDIREQNIRLLKKYKDGGKTSKIVVLPAGLRDIEIQADGRVAENEINGLYRRLLQLANSVPVAAVKNNPEIVNSNRMALQSTFNEIYELIESMIEGKKKLLMGKWAARRVFNGTRNVITSMNLTADEQGAPGNIGINDTMIGLYQFMKAALPVTKFNLKTGFLSKVFPGPSSPANLVNKTTLRSESVRLKPEYYDSWMTEEGLEKVITWFGEESVRHKELEINGYYVGLVYKGPDGTVRLFQDIGDLPAGFDAKLVTPVTFCELMYLSVYHFANTLPILVTRYPITGMGSIYPSMVYLVPTVKTEVRRLLNDEWELDENAPVAYKFPLKTDFVNALSPHPCHLGLLGADYDGDTCSGNIAYSDEAKREIGDFFQRRKYYVNAGGSLNYSSATDTIKFVLKNMTGNPK